MRDSEFDARNKEMVARMAASPDVLEASQQWLRTTYAHEYSHHFEWMGLPIIQYPQDVVALQEIIWRVKPSVIVETGIARGGSLVFHASMLQLTGGGRVIGIDIDIREHNRAVIEAHPMAPRITLIEGSSVDDATVERVRAEIGGDGPVLVVLDSHHTHAHVLAETRLYGPMVTPGSYMVVFDTIVDELPAEASSHRDWAPGNSPLSAVHAFLAETSTFAVDDSVTDRLMITAARGGYLRRLDV